MRKLITLIICLLLGYNSSFSQTYDEMLKAVSGTFKKDEASAGITFTKIIEVGNVSKDELYERVMPFFTYYYKSGESKIQVANKEQSYILARGLYSEFSYEYHSMLNYSCQYSAEHVIKIDFKDNRIRISITIEKITESRTDKRSPNYHDLILMYPVASMQKEKMSKDEKRDLKLFYKLYANIESTFNNVVKYVKKANSQNEDW